MIRKVRIDELDSLIPLAKVFYKEGKILGKFIPKVFKRNWVAFISSGIGVIYGEYRGDKLVGAIGGVYCADPNDGVLVASEFFWFVLPEHRGNGIKLFFNFEQWAKARGVKRLIMVYLHGLMPKYVKTVYEKLNMKELETHYWKEI